MYSEIFEEIGLSPNEAKIYETLVGRSEISVSNISTHGNIHRRNVYDALNRLIEKGLVFQIFQKNENLYRAVHPQKLLEVVKEKESKILNILPKLAARYEAKPTAEAAFIYKGLEGYKNYMRDMVRVAEPTYFLGAKALWFTPNIEKYFLTDFRETFEKRKIPYFTLFDHQVVEKMPHAISEVGGEYKVLPKKYSTPGVCDIFGDYVVTFSSVDVGNFGEHGSIFVMINHDLAETYRTWFKLIWDLCPETKKESRAS
jgi:sugar-specific transcriptional regulator TrmB